MKSVSGYKSVSESEYVGTYLLGSSRPGDELKLTPSIYATLRDQYDGSRTGEYVGIELVIGDLIIAVRSTDTEDTCSLFDVGETFYNIQGTGYTKKGDRVYLEYVVGVTDPTVSPCRDHPVQHDPGMRLD